VAEIQVIIGHENSEGEGAVGYDTGEMKASRSEVARAVIRKTSSSAAVPSCSIGCWTRRFRVFAEALQRLGE
jgi:hypothetical protein